MSAGIVGLVPAFVAALFFAATVAFAQEDDFYHPELTWRTIETPHFLINYHEGAERTARAVATIAEDVYEPVTSLYNHVPDGKVNFIIKDVDDISNGAAYFYENRIEIYAPSMDFELRGTHNWLRNVVTHEFTHIVQIQTSMKFGRRVPAIYFQWLDYESERRQDVLYGYPNVVVSYPFSGFVVPVWFAEGVAQYNRAELRYDFWDTHRDMILRSYALDGNMLGWEEMGVFGKTSLGNESSYNAGFAFVSYLARTYGEEKVRDVSRNLSSFGALTIDGAIEKAVGKSGPEVYAEWRAALEKDYASRVEPVRRNLRTGEPLKVDDRAEIVNPKQLEGPEGFMRADVRGEAPWAPQSLPCCRVNASTGFANLYPVYAPDGRRIAYASTKGADYFGLSALYVLDIETGKEIMVRGNVRTMPAWAPDGKKLYYAKLTRDNPHWSLLFDLYVYDLDTEEETRLTRGQRAISPSVSPDGSRIVFVVTRDGTSNLATMASDGSDVRQLTTFSGGEQVYTPRWSPRGDRIVFDYSIKDGRDIASIRPDGSGLEFLVEGDDDSRGATFTPDGATLLFASDRTGIFNLYEMALGTRETRQVTNVLGGAFYPTVNAAGEIIYSLYTSKGYKIYRLPPSPPIPEGDHQYRHIAAAAPPLSGQLIASAGDAPQFDWSSLRTYDDREPAAGESRPYSSNFSGLSIVPFLRIDNYNPSRTGLELLKPGVYLFSNEVLDRTGFFAGAALNIKFERDLFFQFFYRGKLPGLYQLGLEPVATLEVYNTTRKTGAYINLPASTIPVDVLYDLLEFDVTMTQRALSQFSSIEFRYMHSRYTSVIQNFINPETNQLVTGSSDLYLIGNTLALTFSVDDILRSKTMDINPVGRKITLRVAQEFNKFNGDGEYEVTSTGLQPVYKPVDFQRLELTWREHIPLWIQSHTLTATIRGGTIIGPPVDEFFDFYAGGLVGMRGYPFYSLGGNEMAMLGLAYRFPLAENIGVRLAQIYVDKLYASVYGDVGNAWTGASTRLEDFKTDLGVQLRLETYSFYAYPTRFFFDAVYGFSKFDRFVPSANQVVTYGKEWRFYFGVLFGFDFD